MSPIYGAAFLWLIATILWWSGWREETAEGLPDWATGTFLAVWPLAALGRLEVTPALALNGAWLWTMFSVCALAWKIPSARRWTSASAGLLLGSIAVMIGRLTLLPAEIAQDVSPLAISVVVGWLAALLLRSASEQTLAISVCLCVYEAAFALAGATSGAIPEIREAQWLESWWAAVLSARLWSIAVMRIGDQARKWADKIEEKRGGQRS